MFKRKQDLDKHVQSILRRKKDEKERHAQGYQIARLYKEINEYETARRYLAAFLQVRDNNCQAHQLMGEINEGLGKIEAAIESYKRALDLGGFSSSNRHLVLRICELFCEQGTDTQRMKYWLDKCETLYPRSDVIYRLKAQIAAASANGTTDNTEKEKILVEELVNRPRDVDLRIKLLNLFLETGRIEEAYDTAVSTDLTTAFTNSLPWYQCLQKVFKLYGEKNTPDSSFLQMHLHVLRNLTHLSLPSKNISTCVEALKRFDVELKVADSFPNQDEAWVALCGEMKGQFLYLAGLLILKRAATGSLLWQEANQMSGACFLASQKISPLDAQAPWFVRPPEGFLKLFQWWHLQSYDRFSQIGHMIRQLAGNDVTDWSKSVCRQIQTGMGHKRVFEALYTNSVTQALSDSSFFYETHLMVGKLQEPLSWRQLIDIDRVAYQVHLGNLSHLVWLCLQRYSPDMKSQPNYHFNLLENIRFSAKNLENGSCESLCQLDILTFLLATVRCAASSLQESNFLHQDSAGRPTLLPACLNKSLCSSEQEEWWKTMYQFCTNSVKDDFSRLRRLLMRGIEVVRLIGSHGVSVAMQCHLAHSLDAKVESLKKAELGSRCSAAELSALEDRALFYWRKAKTTLERMQKNQQPPLVKNCMFKELGDSDLTPRQVEEQLAEATFSIAKFSYLRGKLEDALEGFKDHNSPWASYYCGEIYMNRAEICGENRQDEVYKALMRKARDCLYQTLDRLEGDKNHELNLLVARGLDDLEVEIQGFDWDDKVDGRPNSIHNPSSAVPADISAIGRTGPSTESLCSTPRPVASFSSPVVNGRSPSGLKFENSVDADSSLPMNSMSSTSHLQPQPSPERLESQIRSLGYSQTTLFKTVLDRNEELVLMHSRMMEQHRNNNNELKTVLTENKNMMEELKAVLAENKLLMDKQKTEGKEVMNGLKKENKEMMDELKSVMIDSRDMLKAMKTDLATLKPGMMQAQAMPPGPSLIMAPPLQAAGPRAPFPGFPPPPPAVVPQYPGYVLNSTMPPPHPPGPPQAPAGVGFHASGIPGSRLSSLGKYKTSGDEDDDEDEQDNGEDLSGVYTEFYDTDQPYNQYFGPDTHDWPLRTSLEPAMPMTPAMPPPRMTMPQPGFFASALRGQSLQYAQTGQPSPTSAPSLIRPGFFSTPMTTSYLGLSPSMSSVNTNSSGTDNVFSGLSSMAGTPANISQAPVSTSAPPASGTAGFEILLHVKAHLPARNASGGITILSTPINKCSVVMMSDAKEMLFHHDISGLQLQPATGPGFVTWTALRIGSSDKESVSIKVDSESDAETLKQTLLKHSSPLGKVVGLNQTSTTVASTPNVPKTVPTTAVSGAATTEAPKMTFGKFTFSETPKLTPDESKQHDREKAVPHKTPPAVTKEDATKPFAGFAFKLPSSSSASTPQGLFSPPNKSEESKGDASFTKTPTKTSQPSPAAGSRSAGKGDEERVDEYEPNIDFKPVINLPALVEKKTGEEDETIMFVERCRMFRYDQTTSQWKERGVGELKILSNKDEVRFRVVMRRDQILKVCANHFISEDMKLTPLASSDRAWCYNAADFSEEEVKVENLAVKFKNADMAKKFKEVFSKCQASLKDNTKDTVDRTPEKSKSAASPSVIPASTTASPSTTSSSSTSLSEMFKPKPGSWNCDGCYIRNDAEVAKCPACLTPKPGTTPAASSASATPSATNSAAPSTNTWGDAFKPKAGSWTCSGCYIQNGAEVLQCPACETLKPGVKKEDLPKSQTSSTSAFGGGSGFKIGDGGGFTFGDAKADSNTPSSSTAGFGSTPKGAAAGATGGFKFGSDGGFTFGGPATTDTKTSSSPSTVFGSTPKNTTPGSSGFKFGDGGGFTFGSSPATDEKATPSSTVSSASTPQTTASSIFGHSQPTTQASTEGSSFSFKPASTFSFGSSAPSSTAPTTTTSTGSGGFSFKFGNSLATEASTTSTSSPASTTTSLTTPVSSTGTGVDSSTQSKDTSCKSLLATLLTSDDSEATEKKGSVFDFSMTPAKPAQPATTKSSDSGFNFTFNKSPTQPISVKSPPGSTGSKMVPGSPEVDERGLYVTRDGDDTHIHFEPIVKLPQNLDLKTGEEDEDILFEARGKLYRFDNGEWKERGLGVVKILKHRENKSARVLMRRDRILKLCCNHRIDSSLNLQSMVNSDGKAWVWYAMDFSEEEGKMEQLALRFRNSEIANEFKQVFDRCKTPDASSTPAEPDPGQKEESEDDDVIFVKEEPAVKPVIKNEVKDFETVPDKQKEKSADVIFVKEERATLAQIMKARSFQLPDHFYLYENKPQCPGCLGCTDGEGLPPWAAKPAPEKVSSSTPVSSKSDVKTSGEKVFGQGAEGSLPDFAKLSQSDTETSKSASAKLVFGSGGQGLDFSSLAGQSSSKGFAFNKDTSGPFKFEGAGQAVFGATSPGGGEGDDDSVAASHDIHFEPVIPLPELVEVKTGEEDWVNLFVHRAKLYKFYTNVSQWKECGVGEIKIMKHEAENRFRVLMRRDQILKLACNHLISTDMKLKPMSSSETAWCWVALDFPDSDGEPAIEQFAVRFKKVVVAQDFKRIFEECQAKLHENPEETSFTETYSSELTGHGKSQHKGVIQEILKESQSVPLGDKGNVYHTKALDVIGQDVVQASSYTPLGQKEITEQTISQSHSVPLGDKGNVYHTKALDVIGQDVVQASSYTPLGQKEITEQTISQRQSVPLGDKGNVYHTKTLDVIGQDVVQASSYTTLGQKEIIEQTISQSQSEPLGDKGNVYHTKALDVIGQDVVHTSSYTPFGQKEITEQSISQSHSVPLGDKGNVYHTKALDVIGQDVVQASSYTPLGQKEITEQTISQSQSVPLGDKGNVYHTKALDVTGQYVVQASSYTPLVQKEITEQTISQSQSVPLGDKRNVYHTKALNVVGQDVVHSSSYTPLGQKEITEQTISQSQSVPLGEKGNVYHTTALNVIGRDVVQTSSYTPLGQKEITEQTISQSQSVPLGDKGNVYHSKALDVIGQDVVQASSNTPLGQKEITEQTVSQSQYVSLGDKGNVYHTKALDVIGQDVVQASSYTPLGQKEITEQTISQSQSVPLGDKGNVYHTKALDVTGQDVVQASSYTPLGQIEITEQTISQSQSVPLRDKGNVYHNKALDVTGQDVVQTSSYTPLGQKEITEQTISQSQSVPLGDKGNVYHTKALDVTEQDVVQASSYTPLGQKEITELTISQSQSVPLGDKRNVYHTKALNVVGQDVVHSSSYTPLGQKEITEQTISQSQSVPLGEKGNVYHTTALNVIGRDVVQTSSYTPLGQKEITEQTISQSQSVPLGDKGNVYHSKALDVIGQDVVQASSNTPLGQKEITEQTVSQSQYVSLGDKGNVYHTKALDVIGQDVVQASSYTPLGQKEITEQTISQSQSVPLGDKGNVYHTKALDVTGQDVVQASSYTPLGQIEITEQTISQSQSVPLRDKGNVYHNKALDVTGQDVVQTSSYTPLGQKEITEQTISQSQSVPLGDKGNVYHTKALDVTEQDVVQASSYTPLGQKEITELTISQSQSVPLGDKGNVYHTKALDMTEQDVVQASSYTPLGQKEITEQTISQSQSVPLGDKGNVYHTKALDVTEQDVVQASSYTPLGQKEITEQTISQSQSVPLGDKGNVYHTKALDVTEQDVVQASSYTPLGQKEITELTISQSQSVPLGDKGNVYHTKALDVTEQDVVQASSYTPLGQKEITELTISQSQSVPLGDKGNVYHTKALDVTGQDVVKASSYTPLGQKEITEQTISQSQSVPLGDKGNVYHTKALDVTGQDVVQASSYTPLGQKEITEQTISQSQSVPLGDKGNVYHTKALNVTGQDVVQASSYKMLGQGQSSCPPQTSYAAIVKSSTALLSSSPLTSVPWSNQQHYEDPCTSAQHSAAATVTSTTPAAEGEASAQGQEEGEQEEEEEDEETVIFEKRATLLCFENTGWKRLGVGQLLVKYNDDVNGNSVEFYTDDDIKMCNHIICREHKITLNPKNRSCEWNPIDFSMDEPIRRHFSVVFSSVPAAEEFAKVFTEGQSLAVDSDLSERLSTEIDVPEVFSGGAHK